VDGKTLLWKRRERDNERRTQRSRAHQCGRRTHLDRAVEIAGSELVDRTKELIAEGNVQRLNIRNSKDEKLLEVPLTTGVVVGGAFTILAPVLAALGAMAALLVRVKVEVIRTGQKDEGSPSPQQR
jgi:hypothetical protein